MLASVLVSVILSIHIENSRLDGRRPMLDRHSVVDEPHHLARLRFLEPHDVVLLVGLDGVFVHAPDSDSAGHEADAIDALGNGGGFLVLDHVCDYRAVEPMSKEKPGGLLQVSSIR
jgi:hypothetical protein